MTEKSPRTPDDIARQLLLHLDSLRAAGVEWAPNVPMPEIKPAAPVVAARPAAPPAAPVSVPLPTVPEAVQTSLFAAAGAVAPAGGVDERLAALEALRQRVAACTRCPHLAST